MTFKFHPCVSKDKFCSQGTSSNKFPFRIIMASVTVGESNTDKGFEIDADVMTSNFSGDLIKGWAKGIDLKTPVKILSESMSYNLKIVLFVGISVVNHLMIILIRINSFMKKMLTVTLKTFYDKRSQCFKLKGIYSTGAPWDSSKRHRRSQC